MRKHGIVRANRASQNQAPVDRFSQAGTKSYPIIFGLISQNNYCHAIAFISLSSVILLYGITDPLCSNESYHG